VCSILTINQVLQIKMESNQSPKKANTTTQSNLYINSLSFHLNHQSSNNNNNLIHPNTTLSNNNNLNLSFSYTQSLIKNIHYEFNNIQQQHHHDFHPIKLKTHSYQLNIIKHRISCNNNMILQLFTYPKLSPYLEHENQLK
jgi:hypothetical protein